MKTSYNYLLFAIATLLAFSSCNPIEVSSEFDKNATSISADELSAALSITQLENSDDKVEGDQCVIVKNSRPDLGGVWHFVFGESEKTYNTDNGTIVLTNNGKYQVYYQTISGNKSVKSNPIEI